PRTGYPVSNGVLSVTVIYNKATYADALATALFVLGPKRAMEIVENIKGLDAYIITEKEIFKSSGINRYVK
ncbi:MAG TPA: FAD:protein FMN transferase, partial [candidate division WOR-3 bacterium]|nr:FAD:protein FMN transferase [candidate division WOR-3 bacterium]